MTCCIVYPRPDHDGWIWGADSRVTDLHTGAVSADPLQKWFETEAMILLSSGHVAGIQRVLEESILCVGDLVKAVRDHGEGTEWLAIEKGGAVWSVGGDGSCLRVTVPAALGTGGDKALGFLAGWVAQGGAVGELTVERALAYAAETYPDIGPPYATGWVL